MAQNRFIILGMFVILAMAMFFYLAFKVGTFSLERGTEVTIFFDDATGLQKGGDVKIKGVNFGKVTSLSYKDRKALVKIRLHREAEIPDDVEARIRPESLLGENFLELIIPPDSTAAPLQSGDEITHATKAIDINQFVDKMGLLVERFEKSDLTGNLGKVMASLADNSGKVESMITNLDQLAVDARDLISKNKKSLERTIQNLDRITASFGKEAPRTAENLDQILVRLEKLTDELEEQSPDLAKDLGVAMKNLSAASAELPETLKDFQDLSDRLALTLDNVDNFFLEDVSDLKDIMEDRGIKARVRIW